MAAKKDDAIPPVPVPPSSAAVPPVEPPPAVPVPPVAAPRVDPYATPTTPVPPAAGYAAPGTGYAAPTYTPPQAGPPQGLSIASMILGIGGLILQFAGFGFPPALAAVITGHLAQKRQPYARPFWLTGIITGYVGLGISLILGIVLIVAIIAIMSTSYYG
jgi:hypothetical protein